MIVFETPFGCKGMFGKTCPGQMLPADVLTGEDRWISYLIVMILECPVCKETKRWQCRVDDDGTIIVGAKRAYAEGPRSTWK